MLETLFTFVFATTILAMSPGPDNIFVLTQSIIFGKKQGFAIIFGLMFGCLVHTSLVAFGVSAIIQQHYFLFNSLKIIGACYLIFLAYSVYKSDATIVLNSDNVTKKSAVSLFKKGFLMNVLNPKVTLFFLALFPQFLFSNTLSTTIQFFILGVIFITVSFVVFGSFALLGSTVTNFINKYSKIGFFFKWAQIVVFVCIAILILW
ncbi:LysE family translocator [Polaribacter tangerinus]|uniref:LysE family translocator n=1 Tax=Polaribacter tangerinus TaxID=1920034 RepID=UPI000B4BDC52|nr:LysE family translocator [Polaribacter tangerinus]